MEIVIAILFAVTIGAGYFAVLYSLQGNRLVVMERLKTYTLDPKQDYLPPELHRPLRERLKTIFLPISNAVTTKLIPAQKKALYEKKLITAGNPLGLSAENYLVLKYCAPIATALFGLITGKLAVALLAGLFGLFLPDLWLKASEDRRKDEILKALPDVLDLISVSVEAGMSFDGALHKVIVKSSGPFAMELETAIREMEMGKPRREALKDMSDRINVDDLSLFVSSVLQAEQMGVPMGNVLKLQANQVRSNRRMRAEEQAQKAPVKMLIPMMMFIFPTLFIVLLGPAALKVIDRL